MKVCVNPQRTTNGAVTTSTVLSAPPGNPPTKIICYCGQPTCQDYKAAA